MQDCAALNVALELDLDSYKHVTCQSDEIGKSLIGGLVRFRS